MPFDQAPEKERRERERVFVFVLSASELKAAIVSAAIVGLIATREAEDLIGELQLRNE